MSILWFCLLVTSLEAAQIVHQGLPASPPLRNSAANDCPDFFTPAVNPGDVNALTVAHERKRVKRLSKAAWLPSGCQGTPLVTKEEVGEAEIRCATAIAQAGGEAVVPAQIASVLENMLTALQNQSAALQNQSAASAVMQDRNEARMNSLQAQVANSRLFLRNQRVKRYSKSADDIH